MSVLPQGWTSAELENLFQFVLGGDWGEDSSFNDEDYVDAYCIRGTEFKFWNKEKGATSVPRKIKKASLEKRALQIGDILIEISGGGPDQPVGRTVLIDDDAIATNKDYPKVCTNFIRLARPFSEISAAYLNYYLQSFYLSGEVTKYQGGSNNLRNLKFKEFSQIKIPLAPLNEQIRIADKLDSILAKVERAQARLDKIPGILKRFRQSVLAAATSGELTREWREENNIDKNSWNKYSIAKLSERAFDGPFGSKLKTTDYTSHGVKVVRLENIGHLTFKADKETFISEVKYQDLVNNTVLHDDILFSSFVDEEIRTCLFDQTFGAAINKADCFCIRADRNKIQPRFLMYALGCRTTYQKIKMQVHGITRPRINLSFLKSFEIETPSHAEQAEIVVRVMKLFTKADRIENKYLQTKTRLNLLTQSILAKAFRGELVLQDPEDESADKLFERLRTDKSGLKSKRK